MPNRAGLIALTAEFVDTARELTAANGSQLIFDEVVTLRHCYGGLQTEYAATPDLTVTGKLIGGGLAIGAVLGSADVMFPLDPYQPDGMEHGGTFSANPLSMRAGIVAMDLFGPDEVQRLSGLGDLLAQLLSGPADELGWELRWRGSLLRLLPRTGDADGAAHRPVPCRLRARGGDHADRDHGAVDPDDARRGRADRRAADRGAGQRPRVTP